MTKGDNNKPKNINLIENCEDQNIQSALIISKGKETELKQEDHILSKLNQYFNVFSLTSSSSSYQCLR